MRTRPLAAYPEFTVERGLETIEYHITPIRSHLGLTGVWWQDAVVLVILAVNWSWVSRHS
jgi:hypothetical protein